MRSIALARELFDKLKRPAPGGRAPAPVGDWLTRAFNDLTEANRSDLSHVIGDAVRCLGASGNPSQEIEQLFSYEGSLAHYNLCLLWWIWQNGVELPDAEQAEIVQAAHEAMLGYRLIDLYVDHRKLGSETIALGTYLIRAHERRLAHIFGPGSLLVLGRYADEYARVEYLEKIHRWKACPFSRDEAERIGWKAAPAFAIFHLVFARGGRSEAQIGKLIEGLRCVFAGVQMCDDFVDMSDDLANGFETLAASGFHARNDVPVWRTVSLTEPIGQAGLRLFLRTTLDLWNTAIAAFAGQQDAILLLLAEYRKSQFLSRWGAGDAEPRELPLVTLAKCEAGA